MDIYRFFVLSHVLLAILIVGLALYWLIMDHALRARYSLTEATRLMSAARSLRWPPGGLPRSLRPTLPVLALLLVGAMLITGLSSVVLGGLPTGTAWFIKLGLILALVVHQWLLVLKHSTALVRTQFGIALLIVVLSAWLPR